MKGMGIQRYVFYHSIVCLWVIGLGSAIVLTFVFNFGIVGLYFGYGNGLIALCFCNLYYIYKSKWDMIELQARLNWDETLNMTLDEDHFRKEPKKNRNKDVPAHLKY